MKKCDELYSKESTALQIVCRNKLEKLRLKDYSDSAKFFSDFEKAVNELKAACAKVTEKEKLNYILRTLPESMSHIEDLVDVLQEDQTVEYVKRGQSIRYGGGNVFIRHSCSTRREKSNGTNISLIRQLEYY